MHDFYFYSGIPFTCIQRLRKPNVEMGTDDGVAGHGRIQGVTGQADQPAGIRAANLKLIRAPRKGGELPLPQET